MLATGNEILAVANEHGFAVPAFNISSYSMLHAVVDVCEEKRSPHIIAIHPDELAHTRADMLSSIIRIAHESSVPTAIHLDHGASYEQVLWAIQCGFTSVMIDKSFVPFEENVAETRRVVEAAHAVGLSVEAELGTIGVCDKYGETGSEEILYTNPEDAVRFIEATGGGLAGHRHRHAPRPVPLGGQARPAAGPAGGDQVPPAHPARAPRRLQQLRHGDHRRRAGRHQQDQHLLGHQVRVLHPDARGAAGRAPA